MSKKMKGVKICHECKGRGELGTYYYGEFLRQGICKKCNGKGYLK